MGMFDSFTDENGEERQSKAFGKSLHWYQIGDPAKVRRAPFTDADSDAERYGRWDYTPVGDARTCQVCADDQTLLVIENGIYVGTTKQRDTSVPLFDYHGYNITMIHDRAEDADFVALHRQVAALRASHRLVVRAAYRRPEHAEAVNRAVVALEELCIQAGLDLPMEVPDPHAFGAVVAREHEERVRQAAEDERADAEAQEVAGFAGFPDRDAPLARQAAFREWQVARAEVVAEREVGRMLADTSGDRAAVPHSRYVLGVPVPVAADPMTAQEVADVFVAALESIRDMDNADLLYCPVPDVEWADYERAHGAPGETLFVRHTGEFSRAGLRVVGPGWAEGLRRPRKPQAIRRRRH